MNPREEVPAVHRLDRTQVRGGVTTNVSRGKPAELGSTLQPYEDRLMGWLVGGGTVQEFAAAEGLSVNTAHNWTNKIRDRLGARTMFEAVHLWTMNRPGYVRLKRQAHGEVGLEDCEE
jgi:DNA-binding CsgD family transcriptional regulator